MMTLITSKTTHQITEDILLEIHRLIADCKQEDGNVLPIYPHLIEQYRSTPCNVLIYQGKVLIGFLSVFFFYHDACEVAVMVKPSHRRLGLARKMLADVFPILYGFQMKKLIFSSPASCNKKWFSTYDFSYHSSEYQMQRPIVAPVVIENSSMTIRRVVEEDIPILCAIDSACFTSNTPQAVERFQRLLNDEKYSLYLAVLDDVPVGKVHLCWQEEGSRLTDLAVVPSLQGQGFGRTILLHCINETYAKKKHHIHLDVEAVNQRALNLYTDLGFEITNAYDYWTTPINNPVLSEGNTK